MKNLFLVPVIIHICSFACFANKTSSKKHWNKIEEKEMTLKEVVSNLEYFNLSKSDNLILKKTMKDALGIVHYQYEQFHNNIPVENTNIKIHEKNSKVQLINGKTGHLFEGSAQPLINESLALQKALNFIDAALYTWQVATYEETLCSIGHNSKTTFYPTGKLLWHKPTNESVETSYKLNYKFDIYSVVPNKRQYIYVDAATGDITESINRIANCTTVEATAITNYNGTVNVNVCNEDGHFHLKNLDNIHIEVFDAQQNHFIYQNQITDTDNHFENNRSANEVFWATQKANNYFKGVFERNSIDDEGMPILSWVNYTNEYGNKNDSFWNGNWLLFGSGDGKNFNSLTSIDIVAHEMMHGITEFSANLVYKDEPGALNESFSDIFGEVIEAYAKGTTDWLVGADVVADDNDKIALRNLKNPKDGITIYQQPDTYKGINWWTDKEDFGGVHYNSGVQNYWFYLLAEGGSDVNDNGHSYTIEPIGIDKAAAITYRNLVYYLTPNAVYEDAKNGSIQAAIDLYGADSFEARQTELAWQAVGIGEKVNERSACRISDSLTLLTVISNFDYKIIDVSDPMDTWEGVTLNENGCVNEIRWNDYHVRGGILAPEIWNLSSLEKLRIIESGLDGTIPPEIGNLSNLVLLFLLGNNLSGNIPSEIGKLVNLVNLDICFNNLSGNIPNEIGNLTNLEFLALGYNNLTGAIPSEMGNLTNLKNISFSTNNLTGSIPKEFSNLNNLYILGLSDNNLSGCYYNSLSILCNNLPNTNGYISSSNNFDASWEDFCNTGVGSCSTSSVCETDSLTLLAVYNSITINQPIWGWNTSLPISQWPNHINGFTLNANGCVDSLYFKQTISGTIPPEIGDFSELIYLKIDDTDVSGTIPPEIGNLANLEYLYINETFVTGQIPVEIGNLNNLQYLNLSGNILFGCIPPEIGNLINLTFLDIGNNFESSGLSINCSIPSELGNLTNLESLLLGNNDLSGSIPIEFGNLINLEQLNLGYNDLSGCYPQEISFLCNSLSNSTLNIISRGNNFNATWEDFCDTGMASCITPSCSVRDSLILLNLFKNTKTSCIDITQPMSTWRGITLNENGCVSEIYFDDTCLSDVELMPEIGNLSELEVLVLDEEDILTPIPPEIGNLSKLRVLKLSEDVPGEIPKELWNLTRLEELHFEGSSFTKVPAGISNLTNLQSLILYGGNVNSPIPDEISTLINLTELKLSGNKFTGNIPAELGNLSNLEYLFLSNNNLSGSIPPELGSLTKLKFLYLHYNRLTGPIPAEIENLVSLEQLWLYDNSLSGNIPPEIGNLTSLQDLRLYSNNISGAIPPEILNLKNIKYLNVGYNNLKGCYQNYLNSLCDKLYPPSNYNISNGNNFYATWEDFCNEGAGTCVTSSCTKRDSLVLLKLFKNKTHCVDITQPISTWRGVTLNTNGCVSEIYFHDSCLGSIELIPELGNLSELEVLVLDDDLNISTPIPPELGNLSKLKVLKLSERIPGEIPQELWNATSLEELYLEGSNFTAFPAGISKLVNLQSLGISGNISGSIPAEIGLLTNLISLGLSGHNFTGNIPAELGNLMNLKSLSIGSNNLSGSIPPELGNLTNLQSLYLYENQLTGTIPAEIGNLVNLQSLSLRDNNLSGCYENSLNSLCNLSYSNINDGNNFDATWEDFCKAGAGTCDEIENCRYTDSLTLKKVLTSLRNSDTWAPTIPMDEWFPWVSLNEDGCVKSILDHDTPNQGSIPSEIGNLQSLEEFIYYECFLHGEIPKEIGQLAKLKTLDLNFNDLTDPIPTELADLTNLEYLDLNFNKLAGEIPGNIGNLEKIKHLDLSMNDLQGGLPASLTNLTNLTFFNVEHNNLTGCFPESLSAWCNNDLLTIKIDKGNNFDTTWEQFCNQGPNACDPPVVWPGDMDNNGIVNSNDLLYFGLAFGNKGIARPNATKLWLPQQAVHWDNTVAGVNGVYQDANGDGIVNIADFAAFVQNFGKTHQIKNMRNNESPVSLKLELENSSKYGEDIELIYNLYANFGDGIAPNIYGLSGSINFSDLPVKQITSDFEQSSLQPHEYFSFFNTSTGVLDVSLTRTDKANVKVADPVARLIIIVDDVPTGDPYKITIDNGNFTTVTGGLNGIKSSSFHHNININQGVNSSLSVSLNAINASCDLMGSAVATVTNGIPPYNLLWSNDRTSTTNTNIEAGEYSVFVSDAIGNTAQVEFIIYNTPPVYDQNGNLICGTTCPDYLLPTLHSNNSVFQSGKVLESNSSFVGERAIHFKAGEAITLDKGFYINPEVDFSADIESCK